MKNNNATRDRQYIEKVLNRILEEELPFITKNQAEYDRVVTLFRISIYCDSIKIRINKMTAAVSTEN